MGRLSTLSGCGTDVDQDRDQWRYGRGGVVICEIPQMPLPCAYGNPENVFLSLFAAAALLSPGPASVAPPLLKPLSLFVPCTTACGIPWQQIWRWCHMGEISQTKTSIECSLYSPIPAVDGPLGPNALTSDLTVPCLDGEQSSD